MANKRLKRVISETWGEKKTVDRYTKGEKIGCQGLFLLQGYSKSPALEECYIVDITTENKLWIDLAS